MSRYFKSFLLFIFIAGCMEPYDFVVRDALPGIAIEVHLSDKSFHETQAYPSDGSYQRVKLTRSTDVENVRPEPVTGAWVELIDDQGTVYLLEESETPGVYHYPDPDFSARPGVEYKLRIVIEGEAEIESSWEALPADHAAVGTVNFNEVVRPLYRYEAGERVVRDVKGIETYIPLPSNHSGNAVYYRWSFEPMFIYVAPLASFLTPERKCWIRKPPYLSEYALREDHVGGYDQPLFFMETIRNHLIYNEFSVLVKQHILSREHYYFWKEMQERNQGGLLQDMPPYNLKTNLRVVSGDIAAFGYFAPVRETATRWYLLRSDLSYTVEDTSLEDCLYSKVGPPAPQCLDCRRYDWGGEASNEKPAWWR